MLLPDNFEGTAYRLADQWKQFLPVGTLPIKYLEIGVFYGANAISVANTYAAHPDSEIHAIDPWLFKDDNINFEDVYSTFKRNLERSGHENKIKYYRDFSFNQIPKFEDDYFDLIYIDGDHEPEAVLEDAVLAFRKLKKGGVMIFDDYGWGGPDLTQAGIDSFLRGYHKRIKLIGFHDSQMYVRKR